LKRHVVPLINGKPSPSALGARRWLALALLAMSDFVVVLDASIVNIALPSIGRGLHSSLANFQPDGTEIGVGFESLGK
jgi:hypothetical protein